MLPYFLALAAASFLYVAMADLIPGLHRGRTDAGSMRQILLIGAGVATMLVCRSVDDERPPTAVDSLGEMPR